MKKNILRKFVLHQMYEAEEFCNNCEEKNHVYWTCYGAFLQSKRVLELIDLFVDKNKTIADVKRYLKRKYDMEL